MVERQNQVVQAPAALVAEVLESSAAAAKNIDLDEPATRQLIDQQLRDAGWEVSSADLRHAQGVRPQKGKNLAIAEWPTASGPADYVLFVGVMPVAVVEAKRQKKNVMGALEQSKRYSQGFEAAAGLEMAGPWDGYRVPFLFATNGRPYLEQLKEKSGIWSLDARRKTNRGAALAGWPTPDGLRQKLKQDIDLANRKLDQEPTDYLGLRDYQVRAIRAVEEAIQKEQDRLLVAMATGTGKTRTAIGLIYRLLKSGRFRRVLFLVDRSALGIQTQNAFNEVEIENLQTFGQIFGIKELGELRPDADTKLQIATVQSMVRRLFDSADPATAPRVDDYDCIVIDEAHRGYGLDQAQRKLQSRGLRRAGQALGPAATRENTHICRHGSARRPGGEPAESRVQRILHFKNEQNPKVVVTVDLLTTGIDVPTISNLVFLRRVKSRILYEQMIGRATRLCPDIGKETFRIYDAVGLYAALEAVTDMKPVVTDPNITFRELLAQLERAVTEVDDRAA